jgi:DNA polymerase-3 subunit epsilon
VLNDSNDKFVADQLPDWAHDLVPIDRPLAVLDLETTGTAPFRDRIIEIAVIKACPDGSKETYLQRVNPGIPIPPESTDIHGITDEDVAREPEFRRIAPALAEFLRDCDFGGFNIQTFDLPLLRMEFERADVHFSIAGRRVIDAKTIYHAKEPRNLSAAHEFYCGDRFDGAHSAAADTLATYRVLIGQLRRYSDLPHSIEALHGFCNPQEANYVDSDGRLLWRGDEVYFNFGRHRGAPLREVCVTDPEYVGNLTRGDMPAELKTILAAALQGRLPQRASSARRGTDDARGET